MKQIGPYQDLMRDQLPWVLGFTDLVNGEAYDYAEMQLDEYTAEQVVAVRERAVKAFDKARRAAATPLTRRRTTSPPDTAP